MFMFIIDVYVHHSTIMLIIEMKEVDKKVKL